MKDTESREFQARLLEWKEIHELPGGWPPGRLVSLLSRLEVDEVTESDALDMALMALQDRDPDEAAERVLEEIFGDTMRPGIRHNLAHELTEDRPWEEFADITQQAGIFDAVVLLQQAFPREFDRPDAVAVVVRLETGSKTGKTWLDAPHPDPALLLRILAGGMGDHAVLRRLFGEALQGTHFPEAGAILWHASRRRDDANAFVMISSHQWFDALDNLVDWTAQAWVDVPVTGRP